MSQLAQPWHEREPDRLAWELACLRARGFEPDVDTTPAGVTVWVDLSLPYAEGTPTYRIRVEFPFDYPLASPRFFCEDLDMPRHQAAGAGHLCVPATSADWTPWCSAAAFVDERVRALVSDYLAGPDVLAARELDQPEPRTAMLRYTTGQQLLVPGDLWEPGSESSGEARFVVLGQTGPVVLAGRNGQPTGETEALTRVRMPHDPEVKGCWARIDTPSVNAEPGDLLQAARQHPRVKQRLRNQRKGKIYVAVAFPEEGPTRTQQRTGWLLLTVARGDTGWVDVHPAAPFSAEAHQQRAPHLTGLDAARFLLVGTGSLGGPLALELAKAGTGALTIVDPDVYEAHNTTRHLLALRWSGTAKAEAVARQAEELNPFVETTALSDESVGASLCGDELERLVADHDVVVDTTGDHSARLILDRYTRAQRRPLIVAGLTDDALGGDVVVFRPDSACIHCFQRQQGQGTIPEPPTGRTADAIPAGCRSPTFLGAGFEATEVAAITARTTVRESMLAQYPPADFDWAVVNFRDQPRWQQGTLDRLGDCTQCP